MVKKLIRLALSSEYSRQPIRRTDISAKVLGDQGSRPFKTVFEMAQKALRERFGMELVELPQREKVTASQRRGELYEIVLLFYFSISLCLLYLLRVLIFTCLDIAAQRAEKPSANTNKQWIVQSTLPAEYRCPKILTPAKVQSSATESEYTAIYTLVISVIMLNGGSLPEERLERYLRRVNADNYTPIDSTAKTLERMCREKYIVRNRETDGGEELVEYSVGPRGKMEVGPIGVAGLVREVYGRHQSGGEENGDEERNRDFEDRLRRSLGFRTRGVTGGEENGGGSFNHAES